MKHNKEDEELIEFLYNKHKWVLKEIIRECVKEKKEGEK